jgi:hypothetical protein
MKSRAPLLAILAIGLSLILSQQAQAIVVSVDENGNGINTIGPGFIGTDPGPGGLAGVLIYNLPIPGVQGDVLMQDGVGGPILDIIRFNGNSTLVFYSDTPPRDALADTPSPPGALYANTVTIPEVGPEGNNGATYTPIAGQPGYDPTGLVTSYVFVSDAVTPEPSSLALLGMGVLGLFAFGRRVRARSAA